MLHITNKVSIADDEIELSAVRSRGPGGQNVNKQATAIHLRFDIKASSLPDIYKRGLLQLSDRRISKDGIVVIKAQRYRSQDKNRDDALLRLQALVRQGAQVRKKRVATRATPHSQRKRLDAKTRRARDKRLRKKIADPINTEM